MSLRNNRQISHHPKTTFAGQLVCPHCQTAFPITWRRYWSAPWGNYRCLECRQISYATANFWWVWPILTVAITLGGIVGVLFSTYVFPWRMDGHSLRFDRWFGRWLDIR